MLRHCIQFGDSAAGVRSTEVACRRSTAQQCCNGHLGSRFVPAAVQSRRGRKGHRLSIRAVSDDDTNVIINSEDPAPIDATLNDPPQELMAQEPMAQESIADPSEAVDKAQETVKSTLESIQEPAQNTFDNVSEAASRAAGATAERASEASRAVDGALDALKESASSQADVVEKGLEDSFQSAAGVAQSLTTDIETALTQIQSITDTKLTELVKEVDSFIPMEVKDFFEPIAKHPGESLAIVGSLAAIYTLVTLTNELSSDGSGLGPEDTLNILESGEPALLVDLRCEVDRMESGIPKLRRRAYGKGVAVEPFEISKQASKLLRNSNELQAEITARYILEQSQVTTATTVILMGDRNQDCQQIQSALRGFGCFKTYTLNGGFPAWLKAELPIETGEEATYSVGAVDSLTESVQVFREGNSLSDVLIANSPYAIAAVLSVWTFVNFRYILQFLGVFGLLASSGYFLKKRYETPEDFIRELRGGAISLYQLGLSARKSPEVEVKGSSQPQLEDSTVQIMDKKVETDSDKKPIA